MGSGSGGGNDATGPTFDPGLELGTTGSILGMITELDEAGPVGGGATGAVWAGVGPVGGGFPAAIAPVLPRRSKEKSETREFDTHGTCCPFVARLTDRATSRSTSSTLRPGWLIARHNAAVYAP